MKPIPNYPLGHGAMVLRQSNSAKNPGRLYYICPLNEKHDEFFKWWDVHQGLGVGTSMRSKGNVAENSSKTCPDCCRKFPEGENEDTTTSARSGSRHLSNEGNNIHPDFGVQILKKYREDQGVVIPMFTAFCCLFFLSISIGIRIGMVIGKLM